MSDLISRSELLEELTKYEEELKNDRHEAIETDDENMLFAIMNQNTAIGRIKRCVMNMPTEYCGEKIKVVEQMDRLTERTNMGIVGNNESVKNYPLYKVAEYDELDHGITGQCFEKLADYVNLDEQGLLLRLPCGIGADVYFIPSKTNYKLNILQGHPESNRVYHQTVERITSAQSGWCLECDKDLEYATDHILIDKLYKETWFLTQAEAEQKLKEMKVSEGVYE